MADESLRGELEAVYTACREAAAAKDLEGFLAVLHVPEGAPVEQVREGFDEFADMLCEGMPTLDEAEFVAVKTAGDDLAGLYLAMRDPDAPSVLTVLLMPFRRHEEGWRITCSASTATVDLEEGEDFHAKARELVETSETLQLEETSAEEEQAQAELSASLEVCDTDLCAAVECMAYDFELAIAVNGVPVHYKGGSSYGCRLFGVVEGAEPRGYAALRVGENQITIRYRKTDLDATSTLSVRILVPAGCLLHFERARPAADEVSATFHIPKPVTDDIAADDIQTVELTDAGYTSPTESLLETLVAEEKARAEIYRTLTGANVALLMVDIYTRIADEEAEHAKELEKLLKNVGTGQALWWDEASAAAFPIADYQVDEPVPDESKANSLVNHVIKRTKAAEKLYTDLAEQVDSEWATEFFEWLADQESDHTRDSGR